MALPTFGGLGTAAAATTDIAPTYPTHAAGQIGIIAVETGAGTVPAAPSGYTAHPSGPWSSTTPNLTQLQLYGKRTASSSEAAPTIAIGALNHLLGWIFTVVDASPDGAWYDAIDVISSAVTASEVTALSIPGATTTGADRLVVAVAARGLDTASTVEFSAWANADLANVTEQGEAGTAQGNGGGLVVVTGEKAAAGAYGATTATLAVASQWAGVTMAFKPPAAGGDLLLRLMGENLYVGMRA